LVLHPKNIGRAGLLPLQAGLALPLLLLALVVSVLLLLKQRLDERKALQEKSNQTR
jgi:hypothetical protein